MLLAPSADDASSSATSLLNALDAELEARLLVEPRARLREARAAGLDARVAARLDARETSLARELSSLVTRVDEALASTTLEGSLILSPARLEFGGGSVGDARFTLALPTTLGAVTTSPTSVTIDRAAIELRASSLWLLALRMEAARADAPVHRGPLCAELASLSADFSFASCSADCLDAACSRAFDTAIRALDERADPLIGALSTLTFGVLAQGVDLDRDFVAERLVSPDFVARWQSADATVAMPLSVRWSASSAAPL